MNNYRRTNRISRPSGFSPKGGPLRLAALLALLALVATACGSFDIDVSISEDGSGTRAEETLELDLSGVRTIEVSGSWDADVQLTDSAEPSVSIVLDDNFTKYTDIKVEGSVLHIGFERGNLDPEIGPTATVILPSISEVEAEGASSVAVRGDVSDLTNIKASGASELTVTGLAVSSLEVELDGASEASISGTATSGSVDLDGASSADLINLTWAQVDVDVDGASDVRITATDSVDGSADGASDVLVSGGATVSVSSSGASTVSSN